MRYYTGVGSRQTPQVVLVLMRQIALAMANLQYTLRSGGAKGADSAFESGAGHNKQIFYAMDCTPAAMKIARRFHPAWSRCDNYARRLHGRNAFQVLGPNLNEPSAYCICWTKDGCISHKTRSFDTGGTGTAISIAEAYGVPVINLAIPEYFAQWNEWVKTIV